LTTDNPTEETTTDLTTDNPTEETTTDFTTANPTEKTTTDFTLIIQQRTSPDFITDSPLCATY